MQLYNISPGSSSLIGTRGEAFRGISRKADGDKIDAGSAVKSGLSFLLTRQRCSWTPVSWDWLGVSDLGVSAWLGRTRGRPGCGRGPLMDEASVSVGFSGGGTPARYLFPSIICQISQWGQSDPGEILRVSDDLAQCC